MVVEHLHVFECADSGLISGFVIAVHNEFGLERVEKAFHRRIVPAIPLATHALTEGMPVEQRTIVSRCVGGPLIRVQYRRAGSALSDRHVERINGQLAVQSFAHAPTHDST